MKRGLSWLFLAILIGAFAPAPIAAGHPAKVAPPERGRTALDFAHALMRDNDVAQAAVEAKRFLFFHPESPRAEEARALLDRIGRPGDQSRAKRTIKRSPDTRTLIRLVRLYQTRLRTFRRPGAHCPSYPNCSEYTIQAMQKHGALLGVFMAVDRLWREMTTAGTPPLVRHRGRMLHYDPLEQNDYWLSRTKGGP